MPGKLKLGEVLLSKGIITKAELEEALGEQKKKGGFLGQILIEKNFASSGDIGKAMGELTKDVEEEGMLADALLKNKIITSDQFKKTREKQKKTRQRLTKVLTASGFASQEQIAKVVGKYWGIPYISLADHKPDPGVIHLIEEDFMRRHQLVPVRLEGNKLFVAMSDPMNIIAIDEVRLLTNYQVELMITTERDITLALNRYFSIQKVTKEALSGIKPQEAEAPKEAEEEKLIYSLEEAPIIKLVDTIIDGAINARASDIHLEPQEPEMRARYRIDGILHDIMNVPKGIEGAVVSRIKVLADMDISEKRRPQDGHITLTRGEKQYDLRISSFATVGGEKIVIRILDKSSMLLELSELGFSEESRKVFQSLIQRPHGIILVTGPTGSGKTTTLYSVLSRLNTLTKNIITIEDPVEYKLDGINQSQVNPQAGITFATGLKSIVRQDPDIIMVGEIRDLETAEIATQAALTGHLVFSTLHTNDAPSAVTRLTDIGVEPFLISSSVIGVLAQRLIRIVCPHCKEEYTPAKEELKDIGLFDDIASSAFSLASLGTSQASPQRQSGKNKFYRGKGCEYCFGTGYLGRTGVFEIMKVTESIKELIAGKEHASAIKEQAMKEGMSVLRQSGIEKALNGITTPEEIKRVILIEEE